MREYILVMLCACASAGGEAAPSSRRTISLDGIWQIAEGGLGAVPAAFDRTAPVPGLVDMATPKFESPGSSVSLAERRERKRPADPRREAFWYRRTFRLDGPLPEIARLKIHKARYGTKVFVNGEVAGEHGPNWTPGWFDVRAHLKGDGAENELIVRVGASLAQVPPHLTEGWDFEKSRYIPGIYDSVELVLCGTPHVANIQVVPELEKRGVRAVVELEGAASGSVRGVVREAKSGREVGEASVQLGPDAKAEMTIPIRDARLWTPEDPFLYELAVDTGGDAARARFGLRSFTTDPESGRAILNGRPYFLRGSNVCIYRFFEDAARGGLPWDRDWVRKLHRCFKEMHWNALRYCIGFPPEMWYEIADEEGILIQDEFPIWYGGGKTAWPAEITRQDLEVEYTEWMRERWNHPCVVIWDAQNETTDDHVIAPALMAVRGLDLSNRPWDNGWGTPQRPGDISEAHPYRSSRKDFSFARLGQEDGVPDNGPRNGAGPPYLINEYGWLWINRDGTLPTLTQEVYARLLGESASVAERFEYYARALAAKTEFWRARRRCAGVLHFCGLGYSRHDGQTSDHFTDVRELTYEPNFRRYVSDAFAPTGLMLDFWADDLPSGERRDIPAVVINDLHEPWKGEVRLRLLRGGEMLSEQAQPCEVAPLGDGRLTFGIAVPNAPGRYRLEAALVREGVPDVRSLRDFAVQVADDGDAAARPNVVIILADDLGYGDVRCYNPGHGKIPTPNIDRLAAEGVRFTDGHSSSGVCSPSRYALLTGRYHWRTRLQAGIVDYLERPLIAPDRLTIAGLAKRCGYHTSAIGKWHLGWDWDIPPEERELFAPAQKPGPPLTDGHRRAWERVYSRPIAGGPITRGFDDYFGTDVPNWPPYCFIENDRTVGIPTEFLPKENFQNALASKPGPALRGWELDRILPALGDRACDVIAREAKAARPFFLYMPLTSPHTPIAVAPDWRGKSGLNPYGDFVMETDGVVGRVMEALDKAGVADRTLVLLTSDNGAAYRIGLVAAVEKLGHLSSGPLRGHKGSVWEGGHRVPFIVRWPGVVKPGSVCGQLVHQADIMATLAEIFGTGLPDDAGEDSFSLLPLLRGEDKPVRPHAVSCAGHGEPGVRSGAWKFIPSAQPQLYDLAVDIGETRNLAAEQPARVAEMRALLEKLIADGRSSPGAPRANDVDVRRYPTAPEPTKAKAGKARK